MANRTKTVRDRHKPFFPIRYSLFATRYPGLSIDPEMAKTRSAPIM